MLKRYLSILSTVVIVLSVSSSPISANSAQMQWEGTNTSGAIITDENSPVIVEHEQLTFDIEQFPEHYYKEADDYTAYSGRVTAEYTFSNPSDYTVEATLLFPFGSKPDYGYIRDSNTDEMLWYSDTGKYDITVNGEVIDRTLRHTLSFRGQQFDLEEDMAKLHDGFMEDDFYYPDMTVTQYSYKADNVDTDKYDAATAAFCLSTDSSKTRVYVEGQNGGEVFEDCIRLSGWVESGKSFIVNVIGEPLEQMPEWKFYENGACENEIDGTMTLEKTETTTLQEFLLQEYDPDSGILDYDWYNAMVAAFNMFEWECGVINSSGLPFDFDISDNLMRWYEYDLSFEPGEKLVNTVTAPVYPAIDSMYESSVYEYTYLLSPAKTWSDFGTLDISINTPHYMISDNQEAFEKTEQGYTLHLDGLPDSELIFTLCAEENPTSASYGGDSVVNLPQIIAVVGAAAIAAIILIVFFKKKRKK